MPWHPRHKVPAAPALAAGLLAAGLAGLLAAPWETPLPPAPPVRSARLTVSPDLAPLSFPDIRARALFSPTRTYRPGDDRPPSAPGAPGAALDPAATLTLLGSARAGRRAVGVFRDGAGRTVTTVLGGRVGPWRLVALGRDRAVIARGGERRTLRLGVADGPAPAASQSEDEFGGTPGVNVSLPSGQLGEPD